MKHNHNHTKTVYTCPMHPEIIEDKSGVCPKCKMGLVAKKQSDHNEHAGHHVSMFRDKFWLSLLFTLPVLAYSSSIQDWFHFSPPVFTGSQYIPLIFSTIIFFYGGMIFLKSAVSEIKAKLPGMMTLISLAIITAYVYSVTTEFFIQGNGFFWELATLVTIMLLGHWLEISAVEKAEGALGAIADLLPDKAEKLVNGQPTTVSVSELRIRDSVLVRPGSIIPVDGIVTAGNSAVDEAAISGESNPVNKTINDEVIAGTINQDGALTIRITKIGEDTALAGIMKLVDEAQNSKSNVQVLADKAAFALTIVALLSSLATFIVWFFLKDTGFALERAVTVLIITCPHALGLAIPLVVSISTSLSARNGLLIRKRLGLESARNLNVVLFDKTGTLTQGKHGVTDVWFTKGYSREDIIRLTASLEQNSEHIIGRGIVTYAKDKKIKLGEVTNFSAIPGLGVKGTLQGKDKFLAVSNRYITENKLVISKVIAEATKQAAQDGKTEVYLVKEKEVIGAIALADMIRPESVKAIESLRKMGIKTAMITGDSQEVAKYVSKKLGLNQYFAEVKPGDKAAKVKELQQGGQKVAMVGDGINDAPALTQANIGIAIGAGTDIAIKSADIILVKNNPEDIVKVIKLSKATYRKMLQNLFWAAGYNVLSIPLAAGVLSGMGVILAPAVGAALMSVSTVVVAFNAQLLRRIDLK